MDLGEFRHGGSNVTALRLVDPSNPLVKEALQDVNIGDNAKNIHEVCIIDIHFLASVLKVSYKNISCTERIFMRHIQYQGHPWCTKFSNENR